MMRPVSRNIPFGDPEADARATLPDARALFEKVVSKLSPEVARPLWDRWAAYEYQFSEATAIQRLDARMAELYPQGKCIPSVDPAIL